MKTIKSIVVIFGLVSVNFVQPMDDGKCRQHFGETEVRMLDDRTEVIRITKDDSIQLERIDHDYKGTGTRVSTQASVHFGSGEEPYSAASVTVEADGCSVSKEVLAEDVMGSISHDFLSAAPIQAFVEGTGDGDDASSCTTGSDDGCAIQ